MQAVNEVVSIVGLRRQLGQSLTDVYLVAHTVHLQNGAHNEPGNECCRAYINKVSPPRSPPRWQYAHGDTGFRLQDGVGIVNGLYDEGVVAGRYLVVGSKAVRPHIVPVAVVAFQLVAVAELGVVLVFKSGILNGERVLVVRQLYLLAIGSGGGSNIRFVIRHDLQDKRGVLRVVGLHQVGVEGQDALLAAYPQVSVAAAHRRGFFHLDIGNTVVAVEVADTARLLVVARQTGFGGKPQTAVQVFRDGEDNVVAQSLARS